MVANYRKKKQFFGGSPVHLVHFPLVCMQTTVSRHARLCAHDAALPMPSAFASLNLNRRCVARTTRVNRQVH